MRLFWRLIGVSMRSQMQYPGSFLMLSISYFLCTFAEIAGIWVLFERFHMIKGWTLYEVGLIYGMMHSGFALAEGFARGFDQFALMLRQGEFDRMLLRPINPLFQIACHNVQIMRVGRLCQGLTVLVWSATHLALFSWLHLLVILLSILAIMSLFYGLFVFQAAICFWTIESLELMHIATYGGLQTGQYPINIYDRPLRLIFTLLVPLACVAYYPMASLLKHETLPIRLALAAPLAGFLFLYIACQFWKLGLRRHRSTGS